MKKCICAFLSCIMVLLVCGAPASINSVCAAETGSWTENVLVPVEKTSSFTPNTGHTTDAAVFEWYFDFPKEHDLDAAVKYYGLYDGHVNRYDVVTSSTGITAFGAQPGNLEASSPKINTLGGQRIHGLEIVNLVDKSRRVWLNGVEYLECSNSLMNPSGWVSFKNVTKGTVAYVNPTEYTLVDFDASSYAAQLVSNDADVVVGGTKLGSEIALNHTLTLKEGMTVGALKKVLSASNGASIAVFNAAGEVAPDHDLAGKNFAVQVTSKNGQVIVTYNVIVMYDIMEAVLGVSKATVIDNTTGTRTKTYTLDTAVVLGDLVMLEYTYTAGQSAHNRYAEIAYPYLNAGWRPVLFDTEGNITANRVRPAANDTFYTEIGEISEGETYHVAAVLKAGQEHDDTSGRIYLNGEMVHSGYIPLDFTSGGFDTINVLPGVRAVFTKLTGITELADFDYSSYRARLSSEASNVTVSDSACANFTVTLSDSYTVSELKEALTTPSGSTLTFMYNGRVLPEDAPILEGTRIFVQSKNKRQALSYLVNGGAVPFETMYSEDHMSGTISGISNLTTISDFNAAINASGGFIVSGVYLGEQLMESGYVADNMALRLVKGSTMIEYSLSVENEETDRLISSEKYYIDYDNKIITGILKYTPLSALIQSFTCSAGTEIQGVYAGTEQVTDKIVEDLLTLKVTCNGASEEYQLRIVDSGRKMREGESGYLIDGISGEVMGHTVMLEGKISITEAEKEKTVSFYAPYRTEDGCVLRFSNDGNMYFWGHLLDKWESGREYTYTVMTDTEAAEAEVYIDGEKVMEHLYVPFFVGVANPLYLVANFEPGVDFAYCRVAAKNMTETEDKVYLDNFEVTSEFFAVENNTIYIADTDYTKEQLLEHLSVTRGATAEVYTAGGDVASSGESVSDGMCVIAERRGVKKQYVLRTQLEGIKAAGSVKIYKNEISSEQLLSEKGNIPTLTAGDTLITAVRVSNFNSEPEDICIYVAGYDESGCLLAVGTGESEVPANTDGTLVSASLGKEQLAGVMTLGIYLWNGDLMPLHRAEIRIQPDVNRLDDYIAREEAPNIITSALVHPNYKGLIYEENGENDIQLMLRVNVPSLPEGKTLSDYRVKIVISDSQENIILQSSEDAITAEMNVTFSSKHLKLGDYVLKASLIEKATATEIDYNIWPLRKRSGDISQLSSYVDENGRFIKDGKPKFYIGMYGCYRGENGPLSPEQIDSFKDNGVDGVMPTHIEWAFRSEPTCYSREWLDKFDESGVDVYADMSVFLEDEANRVNFNLTCIEDERHEIERRIKILKDYPAVAGYYIGDEERPEASDKLRWHTDIVSMTDFEKPTFYMDYRGGAHNVFQHNASADIMGLDHYPITYNQDDPGINAIEKYTKYMTDNFINKPVWMALQNSNRGLWTSELTGAQTPSEKQQRNMAMQAVCGGATGIWWYGYSELLTETQLDPEKNPNLAARVDQVTDLNELVGRTMGVNRLFARLGDIIMSNEEPPQISIECADASKVQSIVKRYNGKSYIFVVNTSIFDQTVSITASGARSVKNIYTGESYDVDSQGKFTAVLENIGIGVFEIEQDDYLSHDSTLKNLSLSCGEDSLLVTYDENGDMVINVSEDSNEITYAAQINAKATLRVNGAIAEHTGTISGDGATFCVIAEDGSETEYHVSICKN